MGTIVESLSDGSVGTPFSGIYCPCVNWWKSGKSRMWLCRLTLYFYFMIQGVDWLTWESTGSSEVSLELLTQGAVLVTLNSVRCNMEEGVIGGNLKKKESQHVFSRESFVNEVTTKVGRLLRHWFWGREKHQSCVLDWSQGKTILCWWCLTETDQVLPTCVSRRHRRQSRKLHIRIKIT